MSDIYDEDLVKIGAFRPGMGRSEFRTIFFRPSMLGFDVFLHQVLNHEVCPKSFSSPV